MIVPQTPVKAHLSLLVTAGVLTVLELLLIPVMILILTVFILIPGVAMIFAAIHFDLVVRPRFPAVYTSTLPFYALDINAGINLVVSFVCLIDEWLSPDESRTAFEAVFWTFFSLHLLSFTVFILNLLGIWVFYVLEQNPSKSRDSQLHSISHVVRIVFRMEPVSLRFNSL